MIDFTKKHVEPEIVAKKASKDKKVLSDVFEGVSSVKAKTKYGCAKVLRILSEENPKVLYPHWDFFVDMLDIDNTFLKCDGAFIIANLTRVDSKNKFGRLFNRFYRLLNGESMITATNLVGVSGVIAKAKPELQSKITNKLLSIDRTHHGSECKNIIKGRAILTLDEYYEESKDKKKILNFVRREMKNTRPATRKKAEEFLKRHSLAGSR